MVSSPQSFGDVCPKKSSQACLKSDPARLPAAVGPAAAVQPAAADTKVAHSASVGKAAGVLQESARGGKVGAPSKRQGAGRRWRVCALLGWAVGFGLWTAWLVALLEIIAADGAVRPAKVCRWNGPTLLGQWGVLGQAGEAGLWPFRRHGPGLEGEEGDKAWDPITKAVDAFEDQWRAMMEARAETERISRETEARVQKNLEALRTMEESKRWWGWSSTA
jgi:hypothetical protein